MQMEIDSRTHSHLALSVWFFSRRHKASRQRQILNIKTELEIQICICKSVCMTRQLSVVTTMGFSDVNEFIFSYKVSLDSSKAS